MNIFLSINPKYTKKIFNGKKTVELRKSLPKKLMKGDEALIYATSPVKMLVGAFLVDSFTFKPLKELWLQVQARAGISYTDFYEYYQGREFGAAIFFNRVCEFDNPIPVLNLKNEGFVIPQSFRYVKNDEMVFYKKWGIL